MTEHPIVILRNMTSLELMLEARRARDQADAIAAESARRNQSLARMVAAGIAVSTFRVIEPKRPASGEALIVQAKAVRR